MSHPVFLTHPITGRKVLYANPGYAVRINELAQHDSDEVLAFLFEHQLQPKYRYQFRWNEGDVLMWDNRCTVHAVTPHDPNERRVMHRTTIVGRDQVVAA